MENKINILIGSDINYAPYYGVMLTSLFMNNKESCFDVYLLTDKTWTDKETNKFTKLCKKYSSNFHVYVVNVDIVKEFPETEFITLPAYYRLQVCNILPKSIHKILYLDGDIIINGDIRPLWNTKMEGKGIAWALDCEYYKSEMYKRLKINNKDKSYCNAGVSLYNLDYWRENHLSEKAIDYITQNIESILWMDQDVLNVLLNNNKIVLPLTYNFQTHFFSILNWDNYSQEFKRHILKTAEFPLIVHYSGPLKPWQYQYYLMPYGSMWHKVWKRSLWKNDIKRRPRIKFIKHLIKRIVKRSALKAIRDKEYIKESLKFS